MLELRTASFRYPVRRPRRFRPWATSPGPGIHAIDLTLSEGKILGLVGPNGAGKSTLLQVMANILPLEEGELKVQGTDSVESMRAAIGYMPERVTWNTPGTAQQAIERLCKMRNISIINGHELLDLVGLGARSKDDISTYSQGMKQRLSLAAALLGEPKILLLDEPLNGLDPVAQSAFRTLLKQLAERGTSVVVSSHTLSDLEKLADEFVLMHRGRIVADGPLTEIERGLGIRATLEIAGLGKAPIKFGDEIEVEEIPLHDGEEWAYHLHLMKGEWTTERRSELGPEVKFTRLQPIPAGLETVISAATGLEIEDAGFSILSEVDSDA
ncbi:MAG: ABC transporter ATP-binding protein [Candidatus Thermoplasmatota archaeon]|nr:ABC transporter ATP-binding protein [Candidatus Thermoplasmatota archaeon]